MKTKLLRLSAFALALLAPGSLHAQELWIYCGNLPGCPSGFTERFTGVLRLLLIRLPAYVYVLAILFIMIGGAYMVLSVGDAEKVTKGKKTITWALIGIFVMQFSEALVSFVGLEASTRDSGADLVESVANTLIGSIFDLLYIALLGVAIYCGMWMVLSFGKEDEMKKAQEGMFWAAVGAIVINLAGALVHAFSTL